jgi:hypothetical protein
MRIVSIQALTRIAKDNTPLLYFDTNQFGIVLPTNSNTLPDRIVFIINHRDKNITSICSKHISDLEDNKIVLTEYKWRLQIPMFVTLLPTSGLDNKHYNMFITKKGPVFISHNHTQKGNISYPNSRTNSDSCYYDLVYAMTPNDYKITEGRPLHDWSILVQDEFNNLEIFSHQ